MPGTTAPQRARTSRKPTGLPNPPMMLLVGPEKTGKSYAAAQGTSSALIGMTYWIEIGGTEGTANYYGRIEGARYEIVPHNGTYQDILDAIRWAVAQPSVDGKPNMIVVDNMTALWDMLSDEQALYARRRAERKAQQNHRRAPSLDEPVVVDSDLWNRAKDRWGEVLWLLRRHAGPTLLLARQEIVTAFENDKPTREKTRKIKAERNLPAAVDAIVELHTYGEAHLTGVRTLHWDITPGQSIPFPDFTVDTLLRRLGFEEAVATRQVTETRPAAYLDEPRPEQEQQRREAPSAQQGPQRPPLTGNELVQMVHKALTDENNPQECLRGLREEWGIRTLQQIPTRTKMWGQLDGNALISRCLHHIQEQAKKPDENSTGTRRNQPDPTAPSTPPAPAPAGEDDAREHQRDEDPVPPSDHEVPPPPDPENEEPPPAERPEETSAAEEPQDVPTARRIPAAPRGNRRSQKLAYEVLQTEAEVQAQLKGITKGEHLGPVSEEGAPSLTALRDYVLAQRPALIARLEEQGRTDLAALYRNAPTVDPEIGKKFAAYLNGAPAGQ
ncbi:hypothetical protein [Streptomyces longispororuber]|uniref:hypothetical protein n=1 Tax=Streptomyces longispororuber TaxID=68230 RepID=UPI0036FE8201